MKGVIIPTAGSLGYVQFPIAEWPIVDFLAGCGGHTAHLIMAMRCVEWPHVGPAGCEFLPACLSSR